MLLSVIIHVYNNQKALEDQASMWKTWDLGNKVELIFIDDCSSPPLDVSLLPLTTKCYRILDDIPWNMPGAKNLGALKASGKWLLFYDADQFLDAEGLKKLAAQLPALPANTIFRFNRFGLKDHGLLPIHQNCQVIRKNEYLEIGGYDEDFSGAYGHDDSYFERIWTFYGGKISVLKEPCIFDDAGLATQNLDRDKKRNRLLRRKKMRHLHIISYRLGKALLKSSFIFNLLLKYRFIADGRPQSNIRFKWEEIRRNL
jgi:glycosyltransferase involved in cell wall biosynthesis